jgi:hypothetical protein
MNYKKETKGFQVMVGNATQANKKERKPKEQ